MTVIFTEVQRLQYMAKRHIQRMWQLIAEGLVDLARKHYHAALSLL